MLKKSPLKEGELTDLLTRFDLTQEEARVYLLLSSMTNLEASNIAKMLSINRSAVYPILRSLDEKGLIEAQTQGVNRYTVLPVEPYVEAKLKQARDRLDALEGSREVLVSALVSLKEDNGAGSTKFIKQRAMLAQLIRKLIRGANDDLFLYVNDRRVRQISDHYLKARGERRSDGPTTRVLTMVTAENRPYVTRFADFARIRHTDANPLITFMVRDLEEALLVRPTPDVMEFEYFQDYAIWTDDHSLTATFGCMMERLWDAAEDYPGVRPAAGAPLRK